MMFSRRIWPLMLAVAILLIILFTVYSYGLFENEGKDVEKAPGFSATTTEGERISLEDFEGEAVVIHITSIENPVCLECEKELRAQTEELARLSKKRDDLTMITINMRKNPYSDDGDELASSWWGLNISWYWIEDFDPYPVAGKYVDFWNLGGGTANPTILLLNGEQDVVGVYHVYQMGKGEVDGVQDAETLERKVDRIEEGEWEGLEGEISRQSVSFVGMFVLGVITSVSPCSIALLITMFSYIMTSGGKEGGKRGKKKEPGKEGGADAGDGLLIGIGFTLGMGLVFFVLGLFISSIGEFIRVAPYFYLVAGIVLVILGINNIKPLSEIYDSVRPEPQTTGHAGGQNSGERRGLLERTNPYLVKMLGHSSFAGGFFFGVIFSLGWAPCAVSLVFPVIIWMISQEMSLLVGGLLFFVFGLGHGVPIIPISTASRALRGEIGNRYIKAGRLIVWMFGIVVVAMGVVFIARFFGIYLW